MLILFYTIQQVIPNICTKFKNPRHSSSWEIFDTNFPMYYIGVRDEKNGKRRQKLITASWFSFPQYTWPLSRFIQNLKTLAVIGAEISVMKCFIGERKMDKKKGTISSSMLILFHTIQEVIPNICTKFQNPRCSCSWDIFDTNFPMYYIGVRHGKRRQKLISASWFSFPQYTWLCSRCIQDLKTLALIEAVKSVTEIFIGEKENWTNKGNDKQEEVDSLLHNTTSYTQHLYLGSVVPEKSLTQKKVYTYTHTHKHCYGNDKNYIPRIYFVYRGYN